MRGITSQVFFYVVFIPFLLTRAMVSVFVKHSCHSRCMGKLLSGGGNSSKMLRTNDCLEFLTAILTVDTKEGLLRTATIILQSYYSRFTI